MALVTLAPIIFSMSKFKPQKGKKNQRDKARLGRRQHRALSVCVRTGYFSCCRSNGSRVIFPFSLFHAQAHRTSTYITVQLQIGTQGTCFIYTVNDDVVALFIYIFLFRSVFFRLVHPF